MFMRKHYSHPNTSKRDTSFILNCLLTPLAFCDPHGAYATLRATNRSKCRRKGYFFFTIAFCQHSLTASREAQTTSALLATKCWLC